MTKTRFRNVFIMILDWQEHEVLSIISERTNIYEGQVSKRMVKKQQMRWSQQGAHLLLQVRTRVLNDELREVFRKWYPNFIQENENQRKAA